MYREYYGDGKERNLLILKVGDIKLWWLKNDDRIGGVRIVIINYVRRL